MVVGRVVVGVGNEERFGLTVVARGLAVAEDMVLGSEGSEQENEVAQAGIAVGAGMDFGLDDIG